jgi:protease I
VKGRKPTSFWGDGVPEEIKKAGGDYMDAEVVVDGDLVTSRYPGDLPMFVSETLKMFHKYHKEK